MKKKLALDKLCATYRLQLHKDFGFINALEIHPYLEKLGVSHLYLSPVMESVPGSLHGYDGIDPQKISEERGGKKDFEKLMMKVTDANHLRGVLLDIVPNHLATHSQNGAWWSVLRDGKASPHWKTFDVLSTDGKGKIVLPVLGSRIESVLASKKGHLWYLNGEVVFKYGDSYFPLNPSSVKNLINLKKSDENLKKELLKVPAQKVGLILSKQVYSLMEWQSGARLINYRRFFDINSLIGVRIEDPNVFKWFHKKIFKLMQKYPVIHGLRIDHIDGLTAPGDYLRRLHKSVEWIWIEKILSEKETLPPTWPIMGTTGYEFSNISSRLFVDLRGLLALHSSYLRNVESRWERFEECVYESKKEILKTSFTSEIESLAERFYSFVSKKQRSQFTVLDLQTVLQEVSAALKVYRTYAQQHEVVASLFLESAFLEAESRGRIYNKEAIRWFKNICLKTPPKNKKLWITFKKWEQLTGPLMAKGLEDTALYRYCPLMSLNTVGGNPDWIGNAEVEYHQFQIQRQNELSYSLNATSTHDTKRSEDVRLRIHVISELISDWEAIFTNLKTFVKPAISLRATYMIVETIIGVWPMDGNLDEVFVSRIQEYSVKASREAKIETSWIKVNKDYEFSLKQFIADLLHPRSPKEKGLLKQIENLSLKCMYYGAINSLSLVMLKTTGYGVPDFYQGSELWDLSLVDPDNRRPVDYQKRQFALERVTKVKALGQSALQQDWKSGDIKLWLTMKMLSLRQQHGKTFLMGEYAPVEILGSYREHFLSYLRWDQEQWFWIVIPRVIAGIEKPKKELALKDQNLLNTMFRLPHHAPSKWVNILTGAELFGTHKKASELLDGVCVAILKAVL